MIVRENRIANEWQLLKQFVSLNPGRIQNLEQRGDGSFLFTLHEAPAILEKPVKDGQLFLTTQHRVIIEFPRYYPSVPCEVFLMIPTFHPNIDPVNGFVCLWDRHRVVNNVENAIVKLTAVLSWKLINTEAPHIMQPEALAWYQASPEVRTQLPLKIAPWNRLTFAPDATQPRRRRLSI